MVHPEAEDYKYFMEGKTLRYKVFVYGTLLKGYWNHKCMGEDARFLFMGSTVEPFVMYGRGFPLCRKADEDDDMGYVGRVVGEVWEVGGEGLARMDRLEGHPTFYCRTLTKIAPFPEPKVWMYHWVSGRSVQGERHVPDQQGFLWWPLSQRKVKEA